MGKYNQIISVRFEIDPDSKVQEQVFQEKNPLVSCGPFAKYCQQSLERENWIMFYIDCHVFPMHEVKRLFLAYIVIMLWSCCDPAVWMFCGLANSNISKRNGFFKFIDPKSPTDNGQQVAIHCDKNKLDTVIWVVLISFKSDDLQCCKPLGSGNMQM